MSAALRLVRPNYIENRKGLYEVRTWGIDWSVYRMFLPDHVRCRCGNEFLSHTIFLPNRIKRARTGSKSNAGSRVVSEKLCERCGRNDGAVEVTVAQRTWLVDMRTLCLV